MSTASPFTFPAFDKTAFNCPHSDCRAFSRQTWGTGRANLVVGNVAPAGGPRAFSGTGTPEGLWISFCEHCGKFALWIKGAMVYPDIVGAVLPAADMPDDIRIDFEEARSIVGKSPRGAAALLRLCVEKLCKRLLGDRTRGDINKDIALLVQEGLPQGVQMALDTVRVIGNECVHAGQIDFRDDADTANKLFGLVNFIVEDRITRPKEIAALYGKLPPSKLQGIEKRDAPKSA